MLKLLGFWPLFALFIVVEVLWGGIANVHAANHYLTDSNLDCTDHYLKPSFGGTIVIDSDKIICSDVASFGGKVDIEGRVRGNVVAFGSNVIINGTVDGDVSLYGSQVTLPKDDQIHGDKHFCGDRWSEDGNGQLHGGSVFDCSERVVSLFKNDEGPVVRFWSVLAWIALGILLISLLPEHVMVVRTTAQTTLRRSLVLGLLSLLLALVVFFVSIALIISIPLAIMVIAGLAAGWTLGTVAIGWLIGEYVLQSITPQQSMRPMQVAVGLTVLILAGSLPFIGWLISVGAGLIGLGAVFLSRFGTRLYNQPKQPLTL
ncbi:MAG: hypothetical protein JO123_11110 [Ktedonobacteraceae bacterium]|nr:hypothetical protein [Ktedonobacteraceae bacterium]